MSRSARLQHWEQRSEWPLAVAALIFLAAYAWPILQPDVVHPVRQMCSIVVYAVWALFAVDFITRVVLSDARWHFIGYHIPDLLSVALPVLRPLRLLRLVALIRVPVFGSRSTTASNRPRLRSSRTTICERGIPFRAAVPGRPMDQAPYPRRQWQPERAACSWRPVPLEDKLRRLGHNALWPIARNSPKSR